MGKSAPLYLTCLKEHLRKHGLKQGLDTLLSHAIKISLLRSTSTRLKPKGLGGHLTPQGNLSLKLKIHKILNLILPTAYVRPSLAPFARTWLKSTTRF